MKKITFLLAFLMLTLFASARKFYFSSSTGSDSYSTAQAQNQATPWKTLKKLQTFGNSGAAAGDTFAFKKGDVFDNGYDDFGSMKWWSIVGYTCPSGTANAPIVFTCYGTGTTLPNFVFPNPSTRRSQDKYVLTFEGVGYIVIDSLQFNDTRFPVNDKRTSAFTACGLVLGELPTIQRTHHMTVKNCIFSNTGYGIISAGDWMTIENNNFTNFKSVGDTIGVNDIGADALQPSGRHYLIKNNYISGSWAYANPFNSSSDGLLGGAIETIDDFDSSMVCYNTIIDNSGGFEFGQISGSAYGPNDDTIMYNVFINNAPVMYMSTTGPFAISNAGNLHFWNNTIIENNKSRFTGAGNGGNAMGDGQTYATTNFTFWPPYPLSKSTVGYYTAWRIFGYGVETNLARDTIIDVRNNIIYMTTGLQAKYSAADRPKAKYRNNVYHLVGGDVYPTSLGSGATLATGERIINTRMFLDTTNAYPQAWNLNLVDTSYATVNGMNLGLTRDFAGNVVTNPPSIGAFEYTAVAQTTPTVTSISPTSGTQGVVVTLTGTNFTGATSVILRTGVDAAVPFIVVNSTTITTTVSISASQYINAPNGGIFIVTNASGSNTSSPLFVYTPTINSCTFTYSPWSSCVSGIQTRTVTAQPAGCVGNPPADSLSRTCVVPAVTSFYFNIDYVSIRVVANAAGTINILNTSGQLVTTLPYAAGNSWVSVASLPPAKYTATTLGNSITFSTALQFTTVVTRTTCNSSSDGAITVNAVLGRAPYTYSINSTTVYQSSNIFSNLRRGTYVIRVKDAANTVVSASVSVTRVIGSTCK
jgi:hypothetical protein